MNIYDRYYNMNKIAVSDDEIERLVSNYGNAPVTPTGVIKSLATSQRSGVAKIHAQKSLDALTPHTFSEKYRERDDRFVNAKNRFNGSRGLGR